MVGLLLYYMRHNNIDEYIEQRDKNKDKSESIKESIMEYDKVLCEVEVTKKEDNKYIVTCPKVFRVRVKESIIKVPFINIEDNIKKSFEEKIIISYNI